MHEEGKDNYELGPVDIFSAMNNYILLLFGFACVMSSVFIQQLFFAVDQLRVGLVVAPVMGIILPVYVVTRRFPAGFRKQLLIRRPSVMLGLYVVVATLAAVVIVDYAYALSQKLMAAPDDYVEGLKELKPTSVPAVVVTFLGLCVLAPIAEEIVFRGIVQRIFARNMGDALALVLAGALFGAVHLTPQLLLSMIAFGIFLGYLFFATSNLTYPILAHCVLNTVSYVQLLSLPEDEFASPPSYAQNYWILLLSFVILLYLLIRIRKGAIASTKAPHDRPGATGGI